MLASKNNEEFADLPPREFFDAVCERHGWTMERLAEASGYRLETLQKARRGHNEVDLTPKMRAAILRTSRLWEGRRIAELGEEGTPYRVKVYSGPGRAAEERVIMIPPENEEAVIEELRELLRDFQTASVFGRRSLMERIEQLTAGLRASVPLSGQSQKQKSE